MEEEEVDPPVRTETGVHHPHVQVREKQSCMLLFVTYSIPILSFKVVGFVPLRCI